MTQKKFIFSFYIASWQYVEFHRSGPRNKETFNTSFLPV